MTGDGRVSSPKGAAARWPLKHDVDSFPRLAFAPRRFSHPSRPTDAGNARTRAASGHREGGYPPSHRLDPDGTVGSWCGAMPRRIRLAR
jgi:hypothetical protein